MGMLCFLCGLFGNQAPLNLLIGEQSKISTRESFREILRWSGLKGEPYESPEYS